MVLYVVRHGIAVDISEHGVERDEHRMLTPVGRARVAAAARGLRVLKCWPDRVISSPLVRARETAEILASKLTASARVETADELRPQGTPTSVVALLRRLGGESVMLVGHMPNVSELTAHLAGGDHETDIRFKKSAVACISCEGKPLAGAGTLEWLLQPKALRLLGQERGVTRNPES